MRLRFSHLSPVVVALAACSGSESTTPTSAPTTTSAPTDKSALHAVLVETHRQAVGQCFGGFGKGIPYSAEIVVDGGSVKSVSAKSLSEKYPELPKECVEKVYQSMAVPSSVGSTTVKARFAVKNESCSEPACSDTSDLKCQFARDVRCSVVIDAP